MNVWVLRGRGKADVQEAIFSGADNQPPARDGGAFGAGEDGWGLGADELYRPDFVATGYDRGVPMGTNLFAGLAGATPTFTIRALRDPDGANPDRIQIVKGWVDTDGEPLTRLFDVAWFGDREPGADGKLSPVGSTVKGADCKNSIVAAAQGGCWVDPEFYPAQRAYYYVRVLEVLTPCWLAYDEAFCGPQDLPYDTVTVQQDRAYTSPIRYTLEG